MKTNIRTKTHILKTVNDEGDSCKTYYFARNTEKSKEPAACMKIMVYTDSPEMYIKLFNVQWVYRRWGKTLLCYYRVMKMSSMGTIFNTLNAEINEI